MRELFSEFLPAYKPTFAGSADEIEKGARFDLVITSFLPFFPDVMQKISKPAQLHFTSSGTDKLSEYDGQIDLEGVKITSSAGVNAVSIAEHIIGVMLSFAKNLHLYRDQQNNREWKRYWHQELSGLKVCIVGMGHIGRETAVRCRAMGLKVTACVRSKRTVPDANEVIETITLKDRIHEFDYVILSLPLSPDTHSLIDDAMLTRMNPESVLINVSRGEIVDEEALVRHLKSGSIKGAALDVFETEPLPEDHLLWGFENVILTPHVAGTTQRYMRNMFEILAGLNPTNTVRQA